LKPQAAAHRRFGARLRERGKLARGDHFRQHHGGGLERLDLFLRIRAARPVLHHQHAERIAGAQDRHPEEGMVDFFAGFGRYEKAGCAWASDRLTALASPATRPTTLRRTASQSGGRLPG